MSKVRPGTSEGRIAARLDRGHRYPGAAQERPHKSHPMVAAAAQRSHFRIPDLALRDPSCNKSPEEGRFCRHGRA